MRREGRLAEEAAINSSFWWFNLISFGPYQDKNILMSEWVSEGECKKERYKNEYNLSGLAAWRAKAGGLLGLQKRWAHPKLRASLLIENAALKPVIYKFTESLHHSACFWEDNQINLHNSCLGQCFRLNCLESTKSCTWWMMIQNWSAKLLQVCCSSLWVLPFYKPKSSGPD